MSRILVVEDNPPSRELLQDWLEFEGYEVQSAGTLREALEAIDRVPPDAVLLDIQLGAQDGLWLPKWMRRQANLQHIPVIAVTAHAMMTEQDRILQAGCSSSVSKPIDFHLLQEQLEKWLTVGALLKRTSEWVEEMDAQHVFAMLPMGGGYDE